jgi:hypothetical protein
MKDLRVAPLLTERLTAVRAYHVRNECDTGMASDIRKQRICALENQKSRNCFVDTVKFHTVSTWKGRDLSDQAVDLLLGHIFDDPNRKYRT